MKTTPFIALLCAAGLVLTCGCNAKKEQSSFVGDKERAEKGQADAQARMGARYASGQGVELDATEAFNWFRKAAEQGHVDAQLQLGVRYHLGLGVRKDDTEAFNWYRKGAYEKHALSQLQLGACYANGEGVARDDQEAVAWYKRAANLGLAEAQYRLGVCFSEGRGVWRNDTETMRWILKAAEQNYAEAQNWLGDYYKKDFDYAEAYAWFCLAAKEHRRAAASRDSLETIITSKQLADGKKRTEDLRAEIATGLKRGNK